MNLEDILSERSQPQKTMFYIISFICNVQKRQIHRDRNRLVDFQGLVGGGNEVPLGDDEDIPTVDCGDGCTTLRIYLNPLNCLIV